MKRFLPVTVRHVGRLSVLWLLRAALSVMGWVGRESTIRYAGALLRLRLADPGHRSYAMDRVCRKLGIRTAGDPVLESAMRVLSGVKAPIVFDVGANMGAFSLPLGTAFPGARIYAFEPHPEPAVLLLRNRALNGLENVLPVLAAVSDSRGIAEMYTCSSSSGGHRLSSVTHRKDFLFGKLPFQVATLPLKDIWERLACVQCDLLKIDVEGFEVKVLRSLGELLAPAVVRTLIVECGQEGLASAGSSVEELVGLLRERGYSLEVLETGACVRDEHDVSALREVQVCNLLARSGREIDVRPPA